MAATVGGGLSGHPSPTEPAATNPQTGLVGFSDRMAVRAFALYATLAWLLLTVHWGAKRWFGFDEFLFLVARDGGSFWSVVEGNAEHVSIVPVLIFRFLYAVAGMRFGPYLVVLVSMHVAVAVLLRLIMRRVGVGA